jgi:hypothetical protein
MRKFWMSILTVVLLSCFSFTWQESYDTTQIFEIQGNNIIRLSIETYKEKDGWTPVVLSIGDLEVSLWMNTSGQVTEMQKDGFRPIHSVFTINLTTYEMLKINREREQVEFYIGDSKLKFNHISAEFREIDPGMYELRFSPATVHTMSRLIYWETSRNIYATDQRSGPVDLGKSHIWAKKVD